MKRRLLWIGGVVATLLLVIGLGLWLGGMSAHNQIIRLTLEAKEAGLVFEPVEHASNPKAEEIRRKMNSLRDKAPDDAYIDPETESIAEMIRFMEATQKTHDLAIELGRCSSYGKSDERTLYLEVLTGTEALAVRGKFAISQKDIERFLVSARAINRLSDLLPQEDVVACLVATLVYRYYAPLLQSAAEAFANDLDSLIAIEAVAKQWRKDSYEIAVKHEIGETMRQIDEVAEVNPSESAWDTLYRWAARFRNDAAREKIAALTTMIDACKHWQDDAYILAKFGSGGTNEYLFLGTLKSEELLSATSVRALALTLRAHIIRAKTGHWPSIEELAELGLNTLDPIRRQPYRWQAHEGAQRVVGSELSDRNPVECFVLQTSPERQRSRYESTKTP